MTKTTFIHLSDLHLASSVEHDQQMVLNALFEDLRSFRAAGNVIDAILFTGDLIAKGQYGKTSSEYVREKFLLPLLDAAGLTKDRFFLVPGNHDVETSKLDHFAESGFATFAKHGQVNEIIDNLSDRPYLFRTLENFNAAAATYTNATPVLNNVLFRSYLFEAKGVKIGVACLNSAWRASGKAQDFDYGKLLVGERQVEMLAQSLAGADVKIALIHHPLTWLAPFDNSVVQRAIHRNFHAVFHGHNHTSDAGLLTNSLGKLFISNAGCLYQSREYFNGYSIIDLCDGSTRRWESEVREYYDARGKFDISVRYSADGKKAYEVTSTDALLNLLPSEEYVGAVQERVNAQLLSYAASDVAPKTLHAMFVEPPLSHLSQRQFDLEDEKSSPKYLSLKELAANDKALFFIGRAESGKTTLLNYLCLQANDLTYLKKETHSFYIDVANLDRFTRASVLEAASQFGGGEYRKSEIIRLLAAGRAIVCFDNLSTKSDSALKVITNFVAEFPQCKYCFAVNEEIEQSLNDEFVPKIAVPVEVVYIHSYGRKHTRQLVGNWFPENDERVRERLDAILLSIRLLNIPQTPFLISILLWINERNVQFVPVNHAGIIDTFIDGLLGKLTESKSRAVNDATVKRHFLTELAFHLFEGKRIFLKEIELERFTVDYFESKALTSSAVPFLAELFDKGILIRRGGNVFFKFDCFRAFFLALKLDASQALIAHAFTPSGFLELKSELDYYTGLHRDRLDILLAADDLLDKAYGLVAAQPYFQELTAFDNIGHRTGILSAEMREALQDGLFGKRPSIEEQEVMISDLEGGRGRIVDQAARGDAIEDDPIAAPPPKPDLAVFLETLTLCSMILRNSELVSNVELKREIYSKVIAHWSRILLLILMTIEKAELDGDTRKFGEMVPGMDQELQRYLIQLAIPNVVFNLTHESLGTSKLDKIIREHVSAEPFSITKIASLFLMADLNLSPYLSEIQSVLKDKSCTRYTAELIFFKLLNIYLLKNISAHEASRVESVMGDVFVFLNDRGIKQHNDVIRNSFLSMLQKEDQLRKLRISTRPKGNE